MNQDWDIKPRGELCHKCQTPFVEDQPYHSSLAFGEEGYTRRDFCQTCWPAESTQFTPYSVWQGLFKLPPVETEVLKKETAESLLRRMMEDSNPAHRNAMFILAVMLERKRILVEQSVQQHDGGDLVRVYEHRKTGETFVVPDPQLQLDQLEQVQQEVVAMLGGDGTLPVALGGAPGAGVAVPADAPASASVEGEEEKA